MRYDVARVDSVAMLYVIVIGDGHETFQAETETRRETLDILSETRPRRSSSWDLGRDVWWKK